MVRFLFPHSGSAAVIAAVALAGPLCGGARAGYIYNPDDFAVQVVSSTGLPATGLYDDPQSVLGRPVTWFNAGSASRPALHRAKLNEGPFNVGPNGEKLMVTLNAGTQVTVRMGRRVYDDPSHPYGVDLIVFGNAFWSGTGGAVNDATNLNTWTLGSGVFAERVKVSVSQDGVNWYRFDTGPYADGLFPTNAYLWDAGAAAWSSQESDPTLPVNPALTAADFAGKSAAQGVAMYGGSAGGTGFDLAATGLPWVEYVRVEGLTGFAGGEVDAIAAVTPEPASLGVLAGAVALLFRRRR